MEQILSLPICGIIITITAYGLGLLARKLIPSPLANVQLIANAIIILVILFTPFTIEDYLKGGNIILMFIGPATVILALRIYRQWTTFRENLIPILAGCFAGSAASIFSTWLLCRFFSIEEIITVSMLPKSITAAIALDLSTRHGGLMGITMPALIVTGTLCTLFGPFLVKTLKLKDPVATGIAMGASGHAVGTAAAIELGEVEGAMGGIAIGIMGIITSLIFVILF
jgi:putative effector of murein hydrolase